MGHGDLNMKKSWHPLLHTNQEKVWKKERAALDERKKTEELRKEREQERELQELQRLQEEAGGKKRIDKLDWMYATPAAGTGPSASELEDYLLGKKRVDEILKKGDKEKISQEASTEAFISLQKANTAKDTAAKVRDDPLLSIKAQEQAAYQALLKDPSRLRMLKEKAGLGDGKSEKERRREEKEKMREEKEERRKIREERRRRRDERGGSDSGSEREGRRKEERSRSPVREDRRRDSYGNGRDDRGEGSSSRDYRSRNEYQERRNGDERDRDGFRSRDSRVSYRPRDSKDSYRPRDRDSHYYRPNQDRNSNSRWDNRTSNNPRPQASDLNDSKIPSAPISTSTSISTVTEEASNRAAKLAAMQQSASNLNTTRDAYLKRVEKEELEEMEKEEILRKKAKRDGDGKGSFLLDQARSEGGIGLEERLKRGAGRGLQKLGAD